jgi:hypothetical protein
MGFFERREAREAYDQVYGRGRPHHEVSHELPAGAAKRLAREQADYLWQQQYGRY